MVTHCRPEVPTMSLQEAWTETNVKIYIHHGALPGHGLVLIRDTSLGCKKIARKVVAGVQVSQFENVYINKQSF